MGATAALVDAAGARPVLLVLEDVQWADEASAELMRHLLLASLHETAASDRPLLVVVTARERWPAGAPAALARLPREEAAIELHLEPFGALEAHAMVHALTGARPRTEVTDEILEVTAGNPLLMRSVITRNLDSQLLRVTDGEVTLAERAELLASTDLDDEIRIRLAAVGDASVALLQLAAVLGDGGEVAALEIAAGADARRWVGEAERAGLLHVRQSRAHFVHPQVRQVLYHDLAAEVRASHHLRLAAALESLPEPGGDRAFAIAHHLRLGGADADEARVTTWALRAGDEAWSSGAWSEAKRAYEVALGGTARRTLAAADLTEVVLRTGVAAYYANDDSCPAWLREAAALAAAGDDPIRRTEALLILARFHLIGTAATVGAPAPVGDLEAVLASLTDHPGLRARVLATLADLAFVGLDHDRAAALARQAEAAMQADPDDPPTRARVRFVLGLQAMASIELADARRRFTEAVADSDDHLLLAAETRLGLLDLAEGRFDDAARTLEAARVGERRLASHAGQQLPAAALAGLEVVRGSFASAERLAAEAVALYAIQEYAFTPGMVFPVLAAARLGRGDPAGAREALEQWRGSGGRGTWRYDALVSAMSGDGAAVAQQLHDRPWPAVADTTLFTLDLPCLHVAVGIEISDGGLIRAGLPVLVAAHDRGVVVTLGWPWLLSRLIGDGHAALGEAAAAGRWYRRAQVELATGAAVLERALVGVGLARVALRDGDADRAAALAARSATDLDGIDALLLARSARRLVEEAGGAEPVPPRERVILFTDMVASTELNVRAGDRTFVGLLEEHDRILRGRLRRHDGVQYTHTGDGLSAWFTSATSALACAFGMQEDLERASIGHAELTPWRAPSRRCWAAAT
jgi:tetratricopeptide (TPR) repeat protein